MKKKNNVFKKLLSLLLVAIITMSAVPFTGIQANAATAKANASLYTKNATIQKRLTTLFNNYKPGESYFTKNGKSCSKVTGCHTKSQSEVDCVKAPEKKCNCLRIVKINGKTINLGGSQCLAYARYSQQILFGLNDYTNSGKFKQIGQNTVWDKGADVKKWFEKYKTQLHPGTHLRLK